MGGHLAAERNGGRIKQHSLESFHSFPPEVVTVRRKLLPLVMILTTSHH
jgi:hypothetical protein